MANIISDLERMHLQEVVQVLATLPSFIKSASSGNEISHGNIIDLLKSIHDRWAFEVGKLKTSPIDQSQQGIVAAFTLIVLKSYASFASYFPHCRFEDKAPDAIIPDLAELFSRIIKFLDNLSDLWPIIPEECCPIEDLIYCLSPMTICCDSQVRLISAQLCCKFLSIANYNHGDIHTLYEELIKLSSQYLYGITKVVAVMRILEEYDIYIEIDTALIDLLGIVLIARTTLWDQTINPSVDACVKEIIKLHTMGFTVAPSDEFSSHLEKYRDMLNAKTP